MSFDDDWEIFLDPEAFGLALLLKQEGAPDATIYGIEPEGDRAGRLGGVNQSKGLRVRKSGRMILIPSKDALASWRGVTVTIGGTAYTVADQDPNVVSQMTVLILTPPSSGVGTDGSWVRSENQP